MQLNYPINSLSLLELASDICLKCHTVPCAIYFQASKHVFSREKSKFHVPLLPSYLQKLRAHLISDSDALRNATVVY